MITAKRAKKLAEEAEGKGINFQRNLISNEIQKAAKIGRHYLVVDIPYVMLYKEDYDYFEKLGFKVERPKTKTFVPYGSQADIYKRETHTSYGVIYWDNK